MPSPTADAAPDEPVESPAPADAGGAIVAYAGSWYRKARYIMAALVLGCAIWFGYDGFIGWPAQNAAFDAAKARGEKPAEARRTDLEIQLQRVLAITLPFVAIGIIVWLRYHSRGCYRLENDVLHVPGHPAVPLDAIRQIDKSKWDKKGIAYLDYELEGDTGGKARSGTITLDDFVYQQEATDAILAAIEKKLTPEQEPDVA